MQATCHRFFSFPSSFLSSILRKLIPLALKRNRLTKSLLLIRAGMSMRRLKRAAKRPGAAGQLTEVPSVGFYCCSPSSHMSCAPRPPRASRSSLIRQITPVLSVLYATVVPVACENSRLPRSSPLAGPSPNRLY